MFTPDLSNNNNNHPICKAPECQKTSVALTQRITLISSVIHVTTVNVKESFRLTDSKLIINENTHHVIWHMFHWSFYTDMQKTMTQKFHPPAQNASAHIKQETHQEMR